MAERPARIGRSRAGNRERPRTGVDCSAHKGALSSAAGATIGVLGCGIDVIYMIKQGAGKT